MKALLVSRELAPFTGGGIGAYVGAMGSALVDAGHRVHILTERHPGLENGRFASPPLIHTVDLEAGRAALDAYPTFAMRYAMGVLDALERLDAEHGFDYVEFPDYGAEGYFAIRAKRTLGRFRAVLAVRLHSASWICRAADQDPRVEVEQAILEHLERAALAEADLIVAPGRRILERVTEERHRSGRTTHQPVTAVVPIPIDPALLARHLGEGADAAPDRPEVLFFGKLQHLKGPQDLVAAAVMLLDRGTSVRFRFIGNDSPTGPFGRSMLDFLRSRVPARHAHAFTFEPGRSRERLGPAIRAAAASGGACCFPSLWEAFPMVCLEAMALGAPIVCSDAGGLGEIVQHGESGLLYPFGDPAALAEALRRVLSESELRARLGAGARDRLAALCDPAGAVGALRDAIQGLTAETTEGAGRDEGDAISGSHRSSHSSPASSAPPAAKSVPAVSIVIPFFNLGRYLPDTLESIRAQTFRDLEVIIVDDGSTDRESLALLDRLGPEIRIVRKENGGLSSTRNAGLHAARAHWIMPLDADDLIEPTLVEKALHAVERDPGLSFVSPLAIYFEDDPDQATGGWVPLGLDRDLLLVRNIGGASGGSLIRREAALAIGGYDPRMTSYEDWEFWCRLAGAGHRGTVIPEFLLRYRVRPDSMFRTEAVLRHAALHAYILERHAALAADPSRVMRMLQAQAVEPGAGARALIAQNIRYRVADTINDALKRTGVHTALKGLTVRVLRAGRRSPR